LVSYGSCTYAYKANGSLQAKTCSDGPTTYDYDAFGNLRHVTLPNGMNIDYLIDGQNRRVGKKVNGILAEGFLHRNQLRPAAWLNADGSVRARFIYAGKPNVPEYMVVAITGKAFRLIADQVGSVRLVVDSGSGAVVERIDWDEFGNALSDTASGTQPFGFAGGLRDVHTGLTRFGSRDYEAATGRWTAKDPLRFEGGLTDLYSYVGSDPTNLTDPAGLDVYRCQRPADIPLNPGFPHVWIKTDAGEGGLGACGKGIPGHGGSPDLPGVNTCNNDHQGEAAGPDATCKKVEGVSEACVNAKILMCAPTGHRWGAPTASVPPFYVCWTYADEILDECKTNVCR